MTSTQLRETVLRQARHVVVKIGTALLAPPNGDGSGVGVDTAFIRRIAAQIARLRDRGYQITLVSSGAVGAGCAELKLPQRPTDVADQQAVAAVGQRRLMTHMHQAFARHRLSVGQVLLTRSDFDDRARFLNIRNCVTRLHERNVVPVINENDTVAVDEIRFGDNDLLAAMICNCLRAQALILLTVVDGLLDTQGNVIDLVNDVDQAKSLTRGKSDWGSGGMSSKLDAARRVTDAGEIAVIASGHQRDVLARLLAGKPLGTVFVPADRKLSSRQRWIGLTARPAGTVTIDPGAVTALARRGKSLLASGITQMTGRFDRGDLLLIRDARGREVGRGLSNYPANELRLIMGKRSSQFARLLGRQAYGAVIHRDNLHLVNHADVESSARATAYGADKILRPRATIQEGRSSWLPRSRK